jgi:hypothetical protein
MIFLGNSTHEPVQGMRQVPGVQASRWWGGYVTRQVDMPALLAA